MDSSTCIRLFHSCAAGNTKKEEEMTENTAVTQLQPKTGNREEKRCYGVGDWGMGVGGWELENMEWG